MYITIERFEGVIGSQIVKWTRSHWRSFLHIFSDVDRYLCFIRRYGRFQVEPNFIYLFKLMQTSQTSHTRLYFKSKQPSFLVQPLTLATFHNISFTFLCYCPGIKLLHILFYMNAIFRYSDLFVGGRMKDKRLIVGRGRKNWSHDQLWIDQAENVISKGISKPSKKYLYESHRVGHRLNITQIKIDTD